MPKNTSCLHLILVGYFLLSEAPHPSAASAQRALPLPVEDSVRARSFGEDSPLAFSPDGRWVACVVHNNPLSIRSDDGSFVRTGVLPRSQGGEIWLFDTETGETSNLTQRVGTDWDPTWSPDGHYLAFLSDRGGTGQARLWVWDSVKRDAGLVSSLNVRTRYPMNRMLWTPDSRKILVTAIPEGLSVEDYVQRVLAPTASHGSSARTQFGASVTIYESASTQLVGNGFQSAPMFNLDSAYLRDLFLVEVATGKSTIVVRDHRIGWYALAPDGLRVAYAIPKRFNEPGSYQRVYDVAVVSLATMEEQVVVHDILLDDVLTWSPGSLLLCFGAYDGHHGYAYYVVPANGGALKKVAELPYHSYAGGFRWVPMWDSKGEHLYFVLGGALWRTSVSEGKAVEFARVRNRGIVARIPHSMGQLWTRDGDTSTVVIAHDDEKKRDGFYRIDLRTGTSTRLLEKDECYTCKLSSDIDSYDVGVSGDGRYVAYTTEDAQHAPNLFVSDATFQNPKQLGNLNPQFDKCEMGSVRLIDWLSDGGDRLQGALLLPPDYQQGKKYPLIVWVYPGETLSSYRDRFGLGEFPGPLNLQLFATRGYVVLLPDAPERTADWAAGLAESVLPGVNKLIEMGIADPARVGVMGHSQGGYATLALIVRSKRFKAAMSADGWSDFIAYYGLMQQDGAGYQYGQAEHQLGGPPWQYPLVYIQNSPVFYLDKVDTPLLIIHGSRDDAHPVFLADETFVGLRRLGKRAEYAKYEGEGHSPRDWSFENQLDVANRVIAWFDRYLKDMAN